MAFRSDFTRLVLFLIEPVHRIRTFQSSLNVVTAFSLIILLGRGSDTLYIIGFLSDIAIFFTFMLWLFYFVCFHVPFFELANLDFYFLPV